MLPPASGFNCVGLGILSAVLAAYKDGGHSDPREIKFALGKFDRAIFLSLKSRQFVMYCEQI
jgi:hypothetical protein